jgi:putative protease
MSALEGLANRGYTDGFFQRHESQELQRYRDGSSRSTRQQFVAEVTAHDPETGWLQLDVKNKFAVGDRLELLTPEGNRRFRLETMEDLEGNPMQEAPGGGYRVRITAPVDAPRMGLLVKDLLKDL